MPSWSNLIWWTFHLAVGALVMSALGAFGKRAKAKPDGWRRITPSAMHWVALVGSALAASLMLYVRLFVGSARADAEKQMLAASGMFAFFLLATLAAIWEVRKITRAEVSWHGNMLRFTSGDGQTRFRAVKDVASVERRLTGWIDISFHDGSRLRLDPHARGVPELQDHLRSLGASSR